MLDQNLLRVLLPVIIGGLVVFGATTFYTDFWKKPDLHVIYHRDYTPSQRDILEFRNVGQSMRTI
jgi:hypothetical protein